MVIRLIIFIICRDKVIGDLKLVKQKDPKSAVKDEDIFEKLRLLQIPLIDASSVGLQGSFMGREIMPGKIAIFSDPIIEFNAMQSIVSHEGSKDFQIHFAEYSVPHDLYKTSIILVFSFETLNTFQKLLETYKEKSNTTKKGKMKTVKRKKSNLKSVGSFINEDTPIFSPNAFFSLGFALDMTKNLTIDPESLDLSSIKIFFGRKMGSTLQNETTKKMDYFKYSITIPIETLISLKNAIKTNIKGFENKNKVKFSNLLIKNISKSD